MPVAPGDQENSLPELRNPVVGGVQDPHHRTVAAIGSLVDALDPSDEKLKTFILSAVRETFHVLQDECARQSLLQHA
ncbi:MAG: hypothetical protein R3F14_06485 [Polyangiaceae bacterium]